MLLKDQFIQIMANSIPCSVEDLSDSELNVINKAYELFESKLIDIKALEDEIKRLSIELSNIKAMYIFKDNDLE